MLGGARVSGPPRRGGDRTAGREGAELDTIRTEVTAEYGFVTKITELLGTIERNRIPYGDRGVVITLPE